MSDLCGFLELASVSSFLYGNGICPILWHSLQKCVQRVCSMNFFRCISTYYILLSVVAFFNRLSISIPQRQLYCPAVWKNQNLSLPHHYHYSRYMTIWQEAYHNYTFNQTNNSPKALSRLEIYRQTNNLMETIKRA